MINVYETFLSLSTHLSYVKLFFAEKKGFRLDCRERFEASSQNSIK